MKQWLHQTPTSKGSMDSIALLSKTLHLQPAELLIEHEAKLSSREMECFVSGMILQRKYAFNSDSVESVSQCTKNLAEGPDSPTQFWQELHCCFDRDSSCWHNGCKGHHFCVADTSIIGSAKEVLLLKIETTSGSHRRELRPGQNSTCKVRHKRYKTELAIDINKINILR